MQRRERRRGRPDSLDICMRLTLIPLMIHSGPIPGIESSSLPGKEHKLPALYIQSLQAVPAQEDPDTQREEEQSELLLSYTLSYEPPAARKIIPQLG